MVDVSPPDPPLELAVGKLATAQHGVVTLSQLRALGLSSSAVRSRVACGRFHRVHAGVFAVGHAPLTRNGHYMAAVLTCGRGAVLSHRAAADLLDLRRSTRSTVDVTTPRRSGRERRGIDAHTSATLASRDVTVVDGIACTSVARTLLDLAAVAQRRVVERAFDQAAVLQLLDVRKIEDVLARASGHRAAGVLRAILTDHSREPALTRNDFEARFLAMCRHARLPQPEVNVWIAVAPTGYEADFLWRANGLIAEVDGRDVHTTRHAFEHDRRRDQRLMLLGFRVARFTWRQLLDEPRVVAETVGVLLAQAA
jgi:very-short-patch-repair endonuclease